MKVNQFKFIFDIGMAVIFALLFTPEVTSLAFHEIASIVLGAAVILHVLLNKKWIISVSKKLFSKNTNRKTRLSYLLNIILFIDMFIILISGLLISEVVLPNFRYDTSINWLPLHIVSSTLGLVIIGIHIGLHWNWIKQMTKHFPNWKKPNFLRKIPSKVMVRIFLVMGILFLLPQVTKTVALTPRIFSDSTFRFEEREGHARNIDQNKFDNHSNENEVRREKRGFSILNLVGVIPILIIYSAALFTIAFFTHRFEKK